MELTIAGSRRRSSQSSRGSKDDREKSRIDHGYEDCRLQIDSRQEKASIFIHECSRRFLVLMVCFRVLCLDVFSELLCDCAFSTMLC